MSNTLHNYRHICPHNIHNICSPGVLPTALSDQLHSPTDQLTGVQQTNCHPTNHLLRAVLLAVTNCLYRLTSLFAQ